MATSFRVFTSITDQIDLELRRHVKKYSHIVCPVCNKISYMLYCDLYALGRVERDELWNLGISKCVQVETLLEGYPNHELYEGEIHADICSNCSTIFTVQRYTRKVK